jgi:tetratricopeptide (TPR) repeat protein
MAPRKQLSTEPVPDRSTVMNKVSKSIKARSQLKTGDDKQEKHRTKTEGRSARSQLQTEDDMIMSNSFDMSSLAMTNMIQPTIGVRRQMQTQQQPSVTTFTNTDGNDYWSQINQQQQQQQTQQLMQMQDLLMLQQTKINNLHAQPTVIDVFEAIQREMNDDRSVARDHRVVLYNDVPYVPAQAIAPTSQLDDELKKLNELFEAGFIIKEQYHKRKRDLNEMKGRSFDTTVPHSDYSFIALSSGKRQRTEGSSRSTNRNIRVFISSTFRDMSDEREAIMKKAIPELQKLAKQRGVFLTAVDLRWGITSDQTNEGNTMNICLAEVDRCRPYFVGLLGQRYGWSQPTPRSKETGLLNEADQLLKKTFDRAQINYPWLGDYRDRSVTELEVRHAVLNDLQSDSASRALFYLRRSTPGTRDDDPRLTTLKDELSSSSLKCAQYNSVDELARKLVDDFKVLFDRDFPASSAPGPLEIERTGHLAFQESRSRVYIGRKHYFDKINEHFSKPNPGPIVVVADSGLGKSALMANWMVQFAGGDDGRHLVISNYIGCTAASTDLGRLLRRICAEIQDFWKIDKPIPTELPKLIEKFPEWLNEADARGGCTILFDAINQLEAKDDAHLLRWLPRKFPASVRVLVSTTPGTCVQSLKDREWNTMTVEPLTTEERKNLIEEYLGQYGKKMTQAQLQRVMGSNACQNPLYLRTLLEEIRVFGSFEQLDAHIDRYLRAQSPPELFQLIFQRLEQDITTTVSSSVFSGSKLSLVSVVLALTWVARRGLTEVELLELLGITASQWAPLHLALEEALVSRSGFFTFFHDYMRQAVESRYIRNAQPTYRKAIIEYFTKINPNDDKRVYEEVPYQLEQLQDWRGLASFITDLKNFDKLSRGDSKFDLYRYWRAVSKMGGQDPESMIFNKIQQFAKETAEENRATAMDYQASVGKFLEDIGTYEMAETLYREALSLSEELYKPNSKEVLARVDDLAYLLRLRGKYNDALPLYNRALQIKQSLSREEDAQLAQIMNSTAVLYRLRGEYDKAEPLYMKALAIRQRIFGEIHEDVAQSYNSLGCLLQDMGRYKEAEENFLKSISQREFLLGVNHPDVAMSLNNLAGLYLDWSKYEKAGPIYKRALAIYQMVFGENHPNYAQTLNSMAGLNQEQGKFAEAEVLYKKTVAIKENLLGSMHPELALTLNDFAVLYARQDRFPEAENLYRRALQIRKTVLGENHPDYAQSLKNLGSLFQDQNRYPEAKANYEQCLRILEASFGRKHMDVASALHHLAAVNQLQGLYNEAIPLYNRALDIYYELLGPVHADIALSLNDVAILYFKQGNNKKAEEYYLKSIDNYTQVFTRVHPDVAQALLNIAQFYKATGQVPNAKKYYQESVEIFTQTLGASNPRTLNAIASAKTLK